MRVCEFGCQRLHLNQKHVRLLLLRFYSQKVSTGFKEYDAVFNPTASVLTRADREFEFLGPKTTLQGSVIKMEDAPKLKLPEVMF